MPYKPDTWSDARVERLKVLDERGLSATEIAAALTVIDPACGRVTRNAVIGKLWRTQGRKTHRATTSPSWKRYVKPGPKPTRPKKPRKPRAKPRGMGAALVQELANAPAPSPETVKPFSKLREGECKWVVNDPRSPEGALACGAKTMAATYDGGKSPHAVARAYCRHHVFLSLGSEARRRAGLKEKS